MPIASGILKATQTQNDDKIEPKSTAETKVDTIADYFKGSQNAFESLSPLLQGAIIGALGIFGFIFVLFSFKAIQSAVVWPNTYSSIPRKEHIVMKV